MQIPIQYLIACEHYNSYSKKETFLKFCILPNTSVGNTVNTLFFAGVAGDTLLSAVV